MKVFFGFPYKNIMQHRFFYEKARASIIDSGCEILADWLKEGVDRAKSKKNKSHAESYSEAMGAISKADVCVFDVSEGTMAMGHQLTFALDKGKPSLVLYLPNGTHTVESLFIGGSRSGFLTLKNYQNEKEIQSIVEKFLIRYKNSARKRFNLALDQYLDDYLERQSYETGKTKTDIIKESILLRMNSADD